MILDRLEAIDAALAEKGFPRMSPWWRNTFATFYRSGCRQLVLRVGRRGGKSSSLCRVAVVEGVYGDHEIPPGDVGVVAFVSVSKDEAGARLRTIRTILDALGVAYSQSEGTIELHDRPVVFKVFACTVAAVSGFTTIAVIADEVAKWRDSNGANPATEVLAALRPTMATQPNAKLFLSSSPLANLDAHAKAFDAGDDEYQICRWAPTWIANPTISEEDTVTLERDPRIRSREYGAEPSAAVDAAFDDLLVKACFRPIPKHTHRGRPMLVCDPSGGKHDGWAYSVWSWIFDCEAYTEFRDDGDGYVDVTRYRPGNLPPTLVCWSAAEWRPPKIPTATQIMNHLHQLSRQVGATHVVADSYAGFVYESLAAERKMKWIPISWSNDTKADSIGMLRSWLANSALVLPDNAELQKQLLQYSEKILPSGKIAYGAPGAAFDDMASCVVGAAHAAMLGLLPQGAPWQGRRIHLPKGYVP